MGLVSTTVRIPECYHVRKYCMNLFISQHKYKHNIFLLEIGISITHSMSFVFQYITACFRYF